jgi:pyroglutamyl-peptidase
MLDQADRRPTILLTGFGPFPGMPANASAELVRIVVRRARRAYPGFRFVAAVLPTEWRRAPRLVAALHKRLQPVMALHFGVASETRSIRLETRAHNVRRASLDAADTPPPAATLDVDGPTERAVTIDLAAIADALKFHKRPCTISDDAGGYLCNAVLYQSLASAEVRGNGLVGFVHIPADFSDASLTRSEVVAATLEIIATALDATKTPGAPSRS